MTSFTRASRASAGRARGLRARLSSFSAVRGPVGLLYAPNVRGTAWATGFLSWRRGNVTLTQSRPSATFSHIIFIVDTIDRDRYEIIPRGRHRARCVSRPMSCSRDATPGRGGGRGVAYGMRVNRVCTYGYPRRVTYFPAALPGVRYGLWYCGRIPRRGGERRDPHGRRSRDTRDIAISSAI